MGSCCFTDSKQVDANRVPFNPVLEKNRNNTFRQIAATPEYRVDRKDSLGQAAKENTAAIMRASAMEHDGGDFMDDPQAYKDSMKSEIEKSQMQERDQHKSDKFFNDCETFAGNSLHQSNNTVNRITADLPVDDLSTKERPVSNEQTTKLSGGISFGGADEHKFNTNTSQKIVKEMDKLNLKNSIVSFDGAARNSQDNMISDKAPASPVSQPRKVSTKEQQ